MEEKQRILEYLKSHDMMVLATTNGREAHAAAVYFEITPDLKIRFLSQGDTQKVKDMLEVPHVSVVMFDRSEATTLQASGQATRITEPDVLENLMETLFDDKARPEHGWSLPLEKQNKVQVQGWEITPQYMRLTDFGTDTLHPDIVEYSPSA